MSMLAHGLVVSLSVWALVIIFFMPCTQVEAVVAEEGAAQKKRLDMMRQASEGVVSAKAALEKQVAVRNSALVRNYICFSISLPMGSHGADEQQDLI